MAVLLVLRHRGDGSPMGFGPVIHKQASIAFLLELTIDGVYKARDAAVRHAKDVYHGSDLHLWRRAYVNMKITATKGF